MLIIRAKYWIKRASTTIFCSWKHGILCAIREWNIDQFRTWRCELLKGNISSRQNSNLSIGNGIAFAIIEFVIDYLINFIRVFLTQKIKMSKTTCISLQLLTTCFGRDIMYIIFSLIFPVSLWVRLYISLTCATTSGAYFSEMISLGGWRSNIGWRT